MWRKTASLKAFFGWLTYIEVSEDDPFQKLRIKFNKPKILPRTISLSLLSGLLTEAYQVVWAGEGMALRDVAVLELLFATGIRVSELCSLPLQSIDLEAGSVLIFGKGARERFIQVENMDVLSALRAYYEAFNERTLATGYFFINRQGLGYSDQSVRAIIRKYLSSLCIRQSMSLEGDPYDNADAENFFSRLNHPTRFDTPPLLKTSFSPTSRAFITPCISTLPSAGFHRIFLQNTF